MSEKTEYEKLLAEQEKKAERGIRGARTEADRTRHFSDLHTIQAMRRRVARGDFPKPASKDDE